MILFYLQIYGPLAVSSWDTLLNFYGPQPMTLIKFIVRLKLGENVRIPGLMMRNLIGGVNEKLTNDRFRANIRLPL